MVDKVDNCILLCFGFFAFAMAVINVIMLHYFQMLAALLKPVGLCAGYLNVRVIPVSLCVNYKLYCLVCC